MNLQNYAVQACKKVKKEKKAKQVSMILMNPQNGEIYAMVNVPEYDLNDPFSLSAKKRKANSKKQQEYLNKKWRNSCLNDTYEPGSVFKIVTATAGLESSKVSVNDHFNCPGFRIVEDRKIRCHKVGGHGSETFKEGVMNSCNPVFMDVGARVGVDGMYQTFRQLGLFEKTGIDLPGEAQTASLLHDAKDMTAADLATSSFGQSFNCSMIQMGSAFCSLINGGNYYKPHVVKQLRSSNGEVVSNIEPTLVKQTISKETSDKLRKYMKETVDSGTGTKAKMKDYTAGGKTGTAQKIPRSAGTYIVSFCGFAPVENPQVLVYVVIDEIQRDSQTNTGLAVEIAKKVLEGSLKELNVAKSSKK